MSVRDDLKRVLSNLIHEHDGSWASIDEAAEEILRALGFTRDMLEKARAAGTHDLASYEETEALNAIFARIEALLPPNGEA